MCDKVCESPCPPPMISLRNNWMIELGSEVARQAESSQPTQPNPNPIHKTGRPIETEETSRSSVQEIDTRFSFGCESANLSVERFGADRVRTGRLMVDNSPPSSRRETSTSGCLEENESTCFCEPIKG